MVGPGRPFPIEALMIDVLIVVCVGIGIALVTRLDATPKPGSPSASASSGGTAGAGPRTAGPSEPGGRDDTCQGLF
ncbi:MAG: hypothetical protein CSA58_04365 [Micrococcales bacterium]|nr:MAG: hypothetical protein CSB46_05740 [Micrococcales bacterium]PIE27427.1 MAG: hypothetical protein CSA58_04365 [Micrococcales bacterium]